MSPRVVVLSWLPRRDPRLQRPPQLQALGCRPGHKLGQESVWLLEAYLLALLLAYGICAGDGRRLSRALLPGSKLLPPAQGRRPVSVNGSLLLCMQQRYHTRYPCQSCEVIPHQQRASCLLLSQSTMSCQRIQADELGA